MARSFGVRARGDFGNHAAVAGVLVHGDATTLEMRVRPCTTAAAVSSQVDSMPSTIGSLIAAPLCVLLKCALYPLLR